MKNPKELCGQHNIYCHCFDIWMHSRDWYGIGIYYFPISTRDGPSQSRRYWLSIMRYVSIFFFFFIWSDNSFFHVLKINALPSGKFYIELWGVFWIDWIKRKQKRVWKSTHTALFCLKDREVIGNNTDFLYL